MKKTKILMPILGAAAVAGTVVPVAVACGPKQEEAKQECSVTFDYFLGSAQPDVTFSTTKRAFGKDYKVTIKWSASYLYTYLYCNDLAVYVNHKQVKESKDDPVNGYIHGLYGENSMEITIPASNFDDEDEMPTIHFDFFFDQSSIDKEVIAEDLQKDISVPTEEGSTIKANCISNKDPFEVQAYEYVEFEVDMTKFAGCKFKNGYLYLALTNKDQKLVNITQTGTVHYGSEPLTAYIRKGMMIVNPPEAGWPVEDMTKAETLTVYMQFNNTYTGDNALYFSCCQPADDIIKFVPSVSTETTGVIAQPAASCSNSSTYKGQDYVTRISWIPQGYLYTRLYATSIKVTLAGGEIPQKADATGFQVLYHEKNAIVIKIPHELTDKCDGAATPLRFDLELTNSSINQDVYLTDYSDKFVFYDEKFYDALHTSEVEPVTVEGGTYVEFEAILNNWGNQNLDPHADFYIGLYNRNSTTDPIIEITQVPTIYYGENVPLDATIQSNGLVKIAAPSEGWGEKGHFKTIRSYLQFTSKHENIEFVLLAEHKE